jgi:hypothetical protein
LWDEEKQRQSQNPIVPEPILQNFTVDIFFNNTKHTVNITPEMAPTIAPIRLLADISKDASDSTLVAKVNGKLCEINRLLLPVLISLQKESKIQFSIEFFNFDSPEGKETFWHSTSHVLGQALGLQRCGIVFL